MSCDCVWQLQAIQCMDVAEQALQALEMLSKKHNKAILHAVCERSYWDWLCATSVMCCIAVCCCVLAVLTLTVFDYEILVMAMMLITDNVIDTNISPVKCSSSVIQNSFTLSPYIASKSMHIVAAYSRPLFTFPVGGVKEFDSNNMPRVLRSSSCLLLYNSEFETCCWWNGLFVTEWSAGMSDLCWLLLNAGSAPCSGCHC